MKVKPVPTIDCPKCSGHGVIPLTDELNKTLMAVKQLGEARVSEVQNLLDGGGAFHPTAFNNRLELLHKAGLLKRERKGRYWIYSTTTKNRK